MGKSPLHRTKRNQRKPKQKLGLPDLEHSKLAVLRSLRAPASRRGYQHAIDEFVSWYCSEPRLALNKTVVLRYRFSLEERGLAAGTINVRMAAVRRLAFEAADAGLLSPELAAGIHRVRRARKLGARIGNWLTVSEASALWQVPDKSGPKGKRGRAILALLLGCGLRRREVAEVRERFTLAIACKYTSSDEPIQGGNLLAIPEAEGKTGPWRCRSPRRLDKWLAIQRAEALVHNLVRIAKGFLHLVRTHPDLNGLALDG